ALKLLVVAGTLVSATVASGGLAGAQLPTTTTELPTTTTELVTTTIAAPTTTTSSTTTSSTTTSSTTSSSTTSTTVDPNGPAGGGLSISVPGAADLSPGTPVSARVVTAQLGAVTVTDGRAGLVAGWTVSVSSSDFTSGAETAAETISRANVAYWSGPATATVGPAMFAPGQPTAQDAASLGAPRTAFSALTSAGGTSATWVPGLVVTLPITAVTGQYHGTITHSVA
ncbi:MAG: hypothetical protein JWO68_1777, partial [Actinomycetia bacterium]|nr:hypothetical protein [Actinomycetes bacterium]